MRAVISINSQRAFSTVHAPRGQKMQGWRASCAEEFRQVRAHEQDENFYGILCAHAIVMLDAFQPTAENEKSQMIEAGMRLCQVQNNWISLLCMEGDNGRRELRPHVVRLVCRFARLLLALVTDDERCTVQELTQTKELEALAALHSHMGRLSTETLKHFRNYVESLCALYAMQFAATPFVTDLDRAKCHVLIRAQVLGRWLDHVKNE